MLKKLFSSKNRIKILGYLGFEKHDDLSAIKREVYSLKKNSGYRYYLLQNKEQKAG